MVRKRMKWNTKRRKGYCIPCNALLSPQFRNTLSQVVGPARLCLDTHLDSLHGSKRNISKELCTSTSSEIQSCPVQICIFLREKRGSGGNGEEERGGGGGGGGGKSMWMLLLWKLILLILIPHQEHWSTSIWRPRRSQTCIILAWSTQSRWEPIPWPVHVLLPLSLWLWTHWRYSCIWLGQPDSGTKERNISCAVGLLSICPYKHISQLHICILSIQSQFSMFLSYTLV